MFPIGVLIFSLVMSEAVAAAADGPLSALWEKR
jgi:hypothetical protein